jgi:hypothetical protein
MLKKAMMMKNKMDTNYRSLDEIADELHKIERNSIFEIGALLIEAKAGHPGEFLKWVGEEFYYSEDTAERLMRVARLDQRIPQSLRNPLRHLKVSKTTYYALTELKDDELPPVIERLAKESKERTLKIAEGARFIRIEQGRLKYGEEHPAAMLNALMKYVWWGDVIEALIAANPETDEEAEKIAEEALRPVANGDAEAELDAAEASATNEAEDSAEERKRGYADTEAAAAGDALTRAAAATDDTTTNPSAAAYKPFPDMSPTYPKTIGELQEYIEDAFRRGVSPDAKFFIQVDEGGNLEHCEVYFIDDDGCGDPPFMVVTPGNDDAADESDITTTTKVHRKVSLRYP